MGSIYLAQWLHEGAIHLSFAPSTFSSKQLCHKRARSWAGLLDAIFYVGQLRYILDKGCSTPFIEASLERSIGHAPSLIVL